MSETSRAETFKCPNCGAPIEYDSKGERTVKCSYCGESVMVPESLAPRMVEPVVTSVQAEAPVSTDTSATSASSGLLIGMIGVLLGVGVVVFLIIRTVVNAVTPVTIPPTVPVRKIAVAAGATYTPRPTLTPEPSATPKPSPTPAYATPLLTIGSKGIGPGKFDGATAIGTDAKGNIYVGEETGGRIQVFDPDGNFLVQWFAGDNKMQILGFTVDTKGNVSIANTNDLTIQRFDGMTGKSLGTLSYMDGSGFSGLAAMPDGGLIGIFYFLQAGPKTGDVTGHEDLVRYNAQGKLVKTINAPVSTQLDELSTQIAPAVDGQGNIYLLSEDVNAVLKFSSDGKFISRFGSRGSEPGQFTDPSAIAVDGKGNVFVSDYNNIQVFAPDGRFIRSFTVDVTVYGLTFTSANEMLVAAGNTVVKYALGN